MLGELLRLAAHLVDRRIVGLDRLRKGHESFRAGLERAAAAERIRLIGNPSAGDGLAVHAVALVVVHRRERRIDRESRGNSAPPSRVICVSTYEWMRPCSSGSLLKSMPGTTCAVQKATCSVSAKKLSGLRLSTIRPTGFTGTSSSGINLVASSTSKLNSSACCLGEDLHAEFPLRDSRRTRSPPTGRGDESPDRRR